MAETHRDEIAKLEALYAANPEGRVFTHLAEAYRRAGRLDEAREILESGIARHPEYPSAQVVLGRVLLDRGDMNGAAASFRRVLELDRHNLVALRTLGELAGAAGRSGEALHYYRELSHLDPSDEELQRTVHRLEVEASAAEAAPVGEAWTTGSVETAFQPAAEEEAAEAEPMPAAEESDEEAAAIEVETAASSAGFEPGFDLPDADSSIDILADEVEIDGPAEPDGEPEVVTFGLPGESFGHGEEPGSTPEGFEPTVASDDEPVVPAETIIEESVTIASGWWETAPPDTGPGGPIDEGNAEPGSDIERDVEAADWVPQDRWDRFAEPTGPDWAAEPAGEAIGPAEPETGAESDGGDGSAAGEAEDEGWLTPAGAGEAGVEAVGGRAVEEAVETPTEEVEDEVDEPAPVEVREALPAPPAGPTDADAGDEMVTETMAEVYASQGLTERAVEVYRQLRRLRPHDDRIEHRLGELEEVLSMPIGELVAEAPPEESPSAEAREAWLESVESAWTGRGGAAGGMEDSPWAWDRAGQEEPAGGAPIADYFRSLLSWRPNAAASAEPTPVADLVEDGPPAEAAAAPESGWEPEASPLWAEADPSFGAEATAVEDAAAEGPLTESEPAGPSGPALEWGSDLPPQPVVEDGGADELLLLEELPDTESATPSPPDVAAGSSPGAGGPGPTDAGAVEAAFDEWFGAEAGEAGEPGSGDDGPPARTPAAEAGPETEEDLEMFRAWLQSLKK